MTTGSSKLSFRWLVTLFGVVAVLPSATHAALAEQVAPTLSCARSLKASALTPTAVLDFDGDGYSDIVTSRPLGGQTEFSIIRSSDGVEVVDTVSNGTAAPADYDGDGKCDIATVSRKGSGLQWSIKLSTTGVVVTKQLGDGKSRELVGCRLNSGGRASLAYVIDDKVVATQLDSAEKIQLGFSRLKGAALLGCGDITNDGTDDLILRAPSPNRDLDELATVGCSNEILVYRNLRSFQSLGVINRSGLDFPIVIAQRRGVGKSKNIVFEAIAEVVDYPRFTALADSRFSSGYYKVGTGGAYGVLIQRKGSREILRRLLDVGDNSETVAAVLSQDRALVAPQRVGTGRP